MLISPREITWREMLLDWGIAEAETRCAPALSPDTLKRVVQLEPLTSSDEGAIVDTIARVRQPLLTFGIGPPTVWAVGALPIAVVGRVRLLVQVMPAATISELMGMDTAYTRREFSISRMRGRPIIVGPDRAGPWILLEGTHRLCGILNSGVPGPIEVIAGVNTDIVHWHLWRSLE